MVETQALTRLHFLTETQVINKAADVHGLVIEHIRDGRWETKEFRDYPLDRVLLETLARAGFTFEPGKVPPHNNMKYLSGDSRQTGDTFESDCWEFELTEKNPRLSVSFRLHISESMRGVVAVPSFWGNCKGGACHQPTIDRLSKTLARLPGAHPLLSQMAGGSYPVIHWSEINLGGLRSLWTIFNERFGKNDKVYILSHWHHSPFVPSPERQIGEETLFVPENIQPLLVAQWEKQLQDFKDSLK